MSFESEVMEALDRIQRLQRDAPKKRHLLILTVVVLAPIALYYAVQ